jgi:predicted nuclease of restriction endonuclease-like (RecB) superfamily
MSNLSPSLPPDYDRFLAELKRRIASAQVKAALSANRELIALYWEMGRAIVERQEGTGWGDAVLEQLSRDLRREFPALQGFSRRNLYRMRRFYLAYRAAGQEAEGEEGAAGRGGAEATNLNANLGAGQVVPFVPQAVAQIPWGHNILLLEKLKEPGERTWYAQKALEHGWSRAILEHQIESGLYRRQVASPKSSNFPATLPPPQSDLAQAVLKDEYVFDFLTLAQDAKERDLERELVGRIRDFLLELGAGFAFMGRQYPLEVDGQEFFIDLLFYHHRLRCLVALDLKMTPFVPEYAGKMAFYLAVLNDRVRHAQDAPSIGIILCKSKNRTVVEYALQDVGQPIGVAHYLHTQQLPEGMAQALPQPQEFERLLDEAALDEAESPDETEGDAPGSDGAGEAGEAGSTRA